MAVSSASNSAFGVDWIGQETARFLSPMQTRAFYAAGPGRVLDKLAAAESALVATYAAGKGQAKLPAVVGGLTMC